jgi:Protein of unknown function (DUF3025)
LASGGLSKSAPINWSRPWLAPYRAWGQVLEKMQHSGQSVAQGLNTLSGTRPGVRFVPASFLPSDEPYEAFIDRTATVPTRDNLHDFFNGLVWWRFARVKKHLNELHASAIKAQGVQKVRGALRDALTLFDENAAVLQAPELLQQALKQHHWQGLFVTHRALWAQARLTLFGHALLEKLVTPRKNMTAHVWLLPPGEDVENILLASLNPASLTPKPFHPLPVLGVPGWWPENENAAFYDDASVFRAR